MDSFAPRSRAVVASLAAAFVLGTLSCGSPSAPTTGHHNNTTAVYLTATQDSASQGDTVTLGISFTSGDTPGDPLYLEISFDGSLPAVDTISIPPATPNDPTQTPESLNGYLIIPAGLPDGQLTITVVLPDQGDSSSATVTVKDRRAPYFGGAFLVPGSTPNAFISDIQSYGNVLDFIAGATDSVVVSVADNHAVAWIGWAFGPPSNARDSIAVAGQSIQTSMPVAVPASLAGTTPVFSVFARDSDGNMAVDSFGQTAVASYVHHPVRTATIDSLINDIAYDAKRNVLYLSEQGHANILVLSLATMSFLTPLAIPTAPAGIDLTPGGDTLVVALANTGDLAFVKLTGTPTTSVVQLTSLDTVAGDSTTVAAYAQSVRVAADGRIIVGTERIVMNYAETGAVVDLDLTTGQNHVVFSNALVALARSGDATRVIMSGVISYQQVADVYDGVGHQYLAVTGQAGTFQPWGIFMSANQTGSSFLIGDALVDANLITVGGISLNNEPSTAGFGSAISSSGTTVWLGGAGRCGSSDNPTPCASTTQGYYFRFQVPATVRSGEGQLIEVADAPQWVTQLVELPGDHTLIGVGPTEIMAFDLTTSTPGPVSARVASHTPRPRITTVRAEARRDIRVRLGGKTRSLRVTPPVR